MGGNKANHGREGWIGGKIINHEREGALLNGKGYNPNWKSNRPESSYTK